MMMITLILLCWSIFRFCISVWTCVMCMYGSVSEWVRVCIKNWKSYFDNSFDLLQYASSLNANLLRVQIASISLPLFLFEIFWFFVVLCTELLSQFEWDIYALFIWHRLWTAVVCVCVCAVPTYLYCKERKVMHTQWIFIVEKSSQCKIVCGSVVVLCVGAVKGIMTAAAAAVAYAHVSLYSDAQSTHTNVSGAQTNRCLWRKILQQQLDTSNMWWLFLLCVYYWSTANEQHTKYRLYFCGFVRTHDLKMPNVSETVAAARDSSRKFNNSLFVWISSKMFQQIFDLTMSYWENVWKCFVFGKNTDNSLILNLRFD